MSNVLIGIIGVILFIGLALAGVLILGSDFMSARQDSRAAALISQMQQISQAVEMYHLKTGSPFPSEVALNGDPRIMPRFMKTSYVEPEGKGWPVIYDFSTGRHLILGALSGEMCKAIQRNLTGSDVYDVGVAGPPAGRTNGCVQLSNGNIIIYVKV